MYAYRIAGRLFACLLTAAKSLQEHKDQTERDQPQRGYVILVLAARNGAGDHEQKRGWFAWSSHQMQRSQHRQTG
jgi:hypothetical protein